MPETRAEHLAWCKQRALEYLDQGDLAQAVSSMISDMRKHPDNAPVMNTALLALGMMEVSNNNPEGVRSWIVGFT